MAHYALLNEDNIVAQVIVGNGDEQESQIGQAHGARCKRTSYNTRGGVHVGGGTPFRKNYAGIGYTYDAARDAFIPPKPFPSWVLDEAACLWEPPTPMPTDGGFYAWDEDAGMWAVL